MKILSEYELRAKCLPLGTKQLEIDEDTFVMPGAREYLDERGIKLVLRNKMQGEYNVMPRSEITGNTKYVDFKTGKELAEKGEAMTHLYSNVLVPKSHPRIIFRGKLDSLLAKTMETQIVALEEGYVEVIEDLNEICEFVRQVISADVNEKLIEGFTLLNMDSSKIRNSSHHVIEEFGIDHLVPDYKMGKMCISLNSLRTVVREAELAAVIAFEHDGQIDRKDIIEALNRLSSCVYIIYCRVLTNYYNKKEKV
ncbi:MAG TPA: hypothetical protein VFD52_01290 [Clostridia bacterium]|nr:hypothetical protein [Clostridia bacterium]